MKTAYTIHVINPEGKIAKIIELDRLPARKDTNYKHSNFYIINKETSGKIWWRTEIIGSWGNPIAYQRYLGIAQ